MEGSSILEWIIVILGVIALGIVGFGLLGLLFWVLFWISGWLWLHVALWFQMFVYDFGWEVPLNSTAYVITGLAVWLVASLLGGSAHSSK